jgi:hypothetical protein
VIAPSEFESDFHQIWLSRSIRPFRLPFGSQRIVESPTELVDIVDQRHPVTLPVSAGVDVTFQSVPGLLQNAEGEPAIGLRPARDNDISELRTGFQPGKVEGSVPENQLRRLVPFSGLEQARLRQAHEIAPEQLTNSIHFLLLCLEKVDVGRNAQCGLNDLKNYDHNDAQNRQSQKHF